MIDGRDLLAAIPGTWTGEYRVWLEPTKLHTDCSSTLEIAPVLGGKFVSGSYDWAAGAVEGAEGDPQQGSFLLGCNGEAEWQMAWVDSWHNGDSIMWCTGGPDLRVKGSYPTGAEPWFWRTEFAMDTPDQLSITAYNISPGGDEDRATEAQYRRV